MILTNLVPRAFPLKNGWGHFLREKPWGRGWILTTLKEGSVNCFMRSPLKTMIDPFHFFENRHFFSSDSLASPLAFLYSSVFLMKPKSIRLYAMSIMVVFRSLGWNPNSSLIYRKHQIICSVVWVCNIVKKNSFITFSTFPVVEKRLS